MTAARNYISLGLFIAICAGCQTTNWSLTKRSNTGISKPATPSKLASKDKNSGTSESLKQLKERGTPKSVPRSIPDNALAREGNSPPSNPPLTKSAATNGRGVDELLLAGMQAEDEERLDLARQSYERVLTIDPQNGEAHHRLAVIAMMLKEDALAEKHFQQAYKRKMRDAALLSDMGYFFTMRGDSGQGERFLRNALDVDPKHKLAANNLAQLLISNSRDMEARNVLLRTCDSEMEAQQRFAQLAQQARQNAAAIASNAVNSAIQGDPNAQSRDELQAMFNRPKPNGREANPAAIEPNPYLDGMRPRGDTGINATAQNGGPRRTIDDPSAPGGSLDQQLLQAERRNANRTIPGDNEFWAGNPIGAPSNPNAMMNNGQPQSRWPIGNAGPIQPANGLQGADPSVINSAMAQRDANGNLLPRSGFDAMGTGNPQNNFGPMTANGFNTQNGAGGNPAIDPQRMAAELALGTGSMFPSMQGNSRMNPNDRRPNNSPPAWNTGESPQINPGPASNPQNASPAAPWEGFDSPANSPVIPWGANPERGRTENNNGRPLINPGPQRSIPLDSWPETPPNRGSQPQSGPAGSSLPQWRQ